jgi:hypothetical protein
VGREQHHLTQGLSVFELDLVDLDFHTSTENTREFKDIKKFVEKQMGTKDVRINTRPRAQGVQGVLLR